MGVCLCWSLVQETLLGDGQDFVFKWIVNVLHTQASNSFPSIPPSALHNVNLLRDLTDFLTFRREKKKRHGKENKDVAAVEVETQSLIMVMEQMLQQQQQQVQ